MKLKTILIDDDQRALTTLKHELLRYCEEQVEIMGTIQSLEEAVKVINTLEPDLIFLDIRFEAEGKTVFEIFQHIEEVNFQTIFVSAYDEFAIQAFRVSAVDFLLKPVRGELLREAVQKAVEKAQKKVQKQPAIETKDRLDLLSSMMAAGRISKVLLPSPSGWELIKIEDIGYIESDGVYTHLHLNNNSRKTATRLLKDWASMLPENVFYRIHDRYIINYNYIQEYKKRGEDIVIMENGEKLKVARLRKRSFEEWIRKNSF